MTSNALRFIPFLLTTTLLALSPQEARSAERFTEEWEETITLQPTGVLRISNINGPIEIEGWDGNLRIHLETVNGSIRINQRHEAQARYRSIPYRAWPTLWHTIAIVTI